MLTVNGANDIYELKIEETAEFLKSEVHCVDKFYYDLLKQMADKTLKCINIYIWNGEEYGSLENAINNSCYSTINIKPEHYHTYFFIAEAIEKSTMEYSGDREVKIFYGSMSDDNIIAECGTWDMAHIEFDETFPQKYFENIPEMNNSPEEQENTSTLQVKEEIKKEEIMIDHTDLEKQLASIVEKMMRNGYELPEIIAHAELVEQELERELELEEAKKDKVFTIAISSQDENVCNTIVGSSQDEAYAKFRKWADKDRLETQFQDEDNQNLLGDTSRIPNEAFYNMFFDLPQNNYYFVAWEEEMILDTQYKSEAERLQEIVDGKL